MNTSSVSVVKPDFWSQENLKYTQPHYRMRKVTRMVNRLADGKACRLLDVGCGPSWLLSSTSTSADRSPAEDRLSEGW
jgi:predicted TPR repeat methyltransferase